MGKIEKAPNNKLVEKMLSRLDDINGKTLQKAAATSGLIEIKGFIAGFCAAKKYK